MCTACQSQSSFVHHGLRMERRLRLIGFTTNTMVVTLYLILIVIIHTKVILHQALNQLIIYGAYPKSHLRYLHPDNLILFLAIRPTFINVRSIRRDMEGKSNIMVPRFREYVQDNWSCKCSW